MTIQRRVLTGAMIAGLALGLGAWSFADGKMEAAKEQMPPGMEEFMKLAKPGEHHAHLAAGVGSWEITMQMWMEPGKPPTETTGTLESQWILGGRFVETVYKGEFMGEPFEGRGMDGYDNGAKHYTGIWADTLGTVTVMSTGHCEKNGKVRTVMGEMVDPMGQTITNRGVTTVLNADTYKYESYIIDAAGNEMKQMELIAKRRS